MIENSNTNFIFGFIGSTAIIGTLMIFMGCLIAPVFLPIIENSIKNKYRGFKHRNLLVKEEMRFYKKLCWISLIISWIILIAANV